jgi:hypothetical protein
LGIFVFIICLCLLLLVGRYIAVNGLPSLWRRDDERPLKKIKVPAAPPRQSGEPAPSKSYGPGRRRGKAVYTVNIDPADVPGEATAEEIKRKSGFNFPGGSNSGNGPE